jgi:hypothetical protein
MTKISKKSQTKQSCKNGVMVSADFQKYNFHNTGTPQEMIDEDNYFNAQMEEEKLGGCIVSIIYVLIFFLIAYLVW